MSTALRIIILVVEIIAYVSICLLINFNLERCKDDTAIDKKRRYIEFIITIIIIPIAIIFLFPENIFLSYKKLTAIAIMLIGFLAWFFNNEIRISFYLGGNMVYYPLGILFIMCMVVGGVSYSSILEPEILLEYNSTEDYIYNVEDELKDIGDAKIAELIDEDGKTKKYFFIIEDENGNDKIEYVEPSNLWYDFYGYPDEFARIEKYIHKSIYKYPEKKKSIETKERIEYRFYINESLLTKIEM